MKTIPMDFTLAVHVAPGDTYDWSKILLARANLNGTLELLTAAWGRLLGYGRYEFEGKTLCELMGLDKTAAAEVRGDTRRTEYGSGGFDGAQQGGRGQTPAIASPARLVHAQDVHRNHHET